MISILTTDEILLHMLQLEAQRGEFSIGSPEEANLWFLDLDHPPFLPVRREHTVLICFSKEEGAALPPNTQALLSLPYSTKELQRLLRYYDRTAAEVKNPPSLIGYASGKLFQNGKEIPISGREEQVFQMLFEHRGEVVKKEALLAAIGEPQGESNLLQVYIYRIRRKLSRDGLSRIRSVRGVGYILADETRSLP